MNESSTTESTDRQSSSTVLGDAAESQEGQLRALVRVVLDSALQNITEIKTHFERQLAEVKGENDRKLKEVEDNLTSVKADLQKSTSYSFTTLTIFATVFIFVALNVNVFQSVSTASEAVFFMLIIAFACGFILSIPLLLMQAMSGQQINAKSTVWWILGSSIAAMLVIYGITYFGMNFEINYKKKKDKTIEANIELIVPKESASDET